MIEVDTITIAGKEYGLYKEPCHTVVREIKIMQKQLAADFVLKHKDKIPDDRAKVNEVLLNILNTDMNEKIMYDDANAEFAALATISFATNTVWSNQKLGKLSQSEFKKVLETCTKFLGGDFTVFLAE